MNRTISIIGIICKARIIFFGDHQSGWTMMNHLSGLIIATSLFSLTGIIGEQAKSSPFMALIQVSEILQFLVHWFSTRISPKTISPIWSAVLSEEWVLRLTAVIAPPVLCALQCRLLGGWEAREEDTDLKRQCVGYWMMISWIWHAATGLYENLSVCFCSFGGLYCFNRPFEHPLVVKCGLLKNPFMLFDFGMMCHHSCQSF